jgi:hypothetical protein
MPDTVPIPQGATIEPIQQAQGAPGTVPIPQGSIIDVAPGQQPPKDGLGWRILGGIQDAFGTRDFQMSDLATGPKQLLTHPVDTLGMVGEAADAGQRAEYEKMYKNPHAAGKVARYIYGTVPLIGPALGNAADKFEAGDYAGGTAQTLGIASQVFSGSPEARANVGAVASKVKSATTTTLAPAAEKLYQSALKPSTTNTPAEVSTLVKTGLDNEIPISKAGADKLGTLIDDLNTKIKAKIKAGSDAGITIDPNKVAERVDPLKQRYTDQVNPEADLKAIDASKEEFLRRQGATPASAGKAPKPTGVLDAKGNPLMDQGTPGKPAEPAQPMSAMKAQQIKQGTYAQLRKKYGEISTAANESQKALARGIREELDEQFPEVKSLNAQDSKAIGLEPEIFKAVNRIGNRNWLSIGAKITGIAAGTAVGGEAGFGAATSAAILHEVISNPMVQSRIAIAISKAAKIPPSVAAAKVSAYVNALGAAKGAATAGAESVSTSRRPGDQDNTVPSE